MYIKTLISSFIGFMSLLLLTLPLSTSDSKMSNSSFQNSTNTSLLESTPVNASKRSAFNYQTKTKSHIAVCLTGQLLRLELGSKIGNLIIPMLNDGHDVSLIGVFDNSSAKFTHPSFYSKDERESGIYETANSDQIENFLRKVVNRSMLSSAAGNFTCQVSIHPPTVNLWNPVQGMPEYCANKHSFQNQMNWRSQLRECLKEISRYELERQYFFDFVIRLRDDSFILKPLHFDVVFHRGYIVTETDFSFGGLNDHFIVIDRKYADDVFRGAIEDYYLNHTVNLKCQLSEIQLLASVLSYHVPSRLTNFCKTPVIGIRGLTKDFNWKFHQVMTLQYYNNLRGKSCLASKLHLLKAGKSHVFKVDKLFIEEFKNVSY